MIAAIVPAHNEAHLIGRCLRSLQAAAAHPALAGEAVKIVVALDRCTDRTARVCRRYGAQTISVNARCVGVARACAAEQAVRDGARWIGCTDADTQVPEDWFAAQLACDADAFCGVVRVEQWEGYSSTVQQAFASTEATRDGHPHVHGANMGFSAQAYGRAGGFAPLACGEDVAFMAALEGAGVRIARLGSPCVVTSARRTARAEGGFSQFLKRLEMGEGPELDIAPQGVW